jgi:hypothetical protein
VRPGASRVVQSGSAEEEEVAAAMLSVPQNFRRPSLLLLDLRLVHAMDSDACNDRMASCVHEQWNCRPAQRIDLPTLGASAFKVVV